MQTKSLNTKLKHDEKQKQTRNMQRKKHNTEALHCSRGQKTKSKGGTPASQTTNMHKTCDA